MRPALLTAILLVLAAPGGGQEWPDLSRRYVETTVGLIRRLPSTRSHWEFIRRTKVSLQVTDNPSRVDDSTAGVYDGVEKTLFVDEVRLLDGAEEMTDRGAAPDTAAEVLAWKFLPTVVHEFTHALVHERVQRALGREVIFPSVEDELLAFYDGALALFDEFDEKPELWRKDRILGMEKLWADVLEAWLSGSTRFDRIIEATYGNRPVLLRMTQKEALAMVDERISSLESDLAAVRESRRTLERLGPEAAGIPYRTYQKVDASLRYGERLLEMSRSTRRALEDAAGWEKLRAFYKEELSRRRELLEARRERLK